MRAGKTLLAIGLLLLVLTALAGFLQPRPLPADRIRLVWVSDANPARVAQIEGFNRDNPDLLLELDPSNTGLAKVSRLTSSGLGPDLFDVNDQDLQSYVELQLATEVTAAAEHLGFSTQASDWKACSDLGLVNGRQFGARCNIGAPILIYNKNVFDYFGVPYPTSLMTWDEFLNLAVKVNAPPTAQTDGIYAVTALKSPIWSIYFESLHGEFFTEDGLLDIRNEKLRQALRWHQQLLFKFRITPTELELETRKGQGGWATGQINQFAQGQFAMILAGDWIQVGLHQAYKHQIAATDQQKSGNSTSEVPLRLGAVLIPHVRGMEPVYRVAARIAGINSQTRHQKEALRVLQYFSGPTYAAIVNREMDWLPGNSQYADLGLLEQYPDLSRTQLHETTKVALGHGYVQRQSPFILTRDVRQVMRMQVNRLEAEPNIDVEELLNAAELELTTLLRRRLELNPALQKLYQERLARR